MQRTRVINYLLGLIVVTSCSRDVPRTAEAASAVEGAAPTKKHPDATDRIAVALSAAPATIAEGATIMDFDASGKLVQLRAGTNGWVCLADDSPAAPGDSPNCLDERWQAFFEAYEKKQPPRITGVGMAYMLQGSLSPSNTDPFAETPPAGSDWMEDGPHVMVIVPDPAQLNVFPSDHTKGGPYVMYKGTPYAHLMVPIPDK